MARSGFHPRASVPNHFAIYCPVVLLSEASDTIPCARLRAKEGPDSFIQQMHTEYLFLCRHPQFTGDVSEKTTPSRQASTTGCSTYVGHSVSAQLTQGTKTIRPQSPPPRHHRAEVGAGPRVPAANAQAVGSPALARARCASCRLALASVPARLEASAMSARACVDVGIAHAHLRWRQVRARAQRRRQW